MSTAHVVKWRTHLWIKYAVFDSYSRVCGFKGSACVSQSLSAVFWKLQSFFSTLRPRGSDQLFNSSEWPSLSRASLEWNVLAKACFHKSFSFFCSVYSSVRSEVVLLRIGGGGVGLMGEVWWWWWWGGRGRGWWYSPLPLEAAYTHTSVYYSPALPAPAPLFSSPCSL